MEMEAEAERRKRAEILQSEGERAREINVAKGEREARILQAQGEAQAILETQRATAEGIKLISKAIAQTPGGRDAMSFRVAEQSVVAWQKLAKQSTTLVVPASPNDVGGMAAQALAIYHKLNATTQAQHAALTADSLSGAFPKTEDGPFPEDDIEDENEPR